MLASRDDAVYLFIYLSVLPRKEDSDKSRVDETALEAAYVSARVRQANDVHECTGMYRNDRKA